jgi:pyruvate dehydrogenase E1 component beta subunit
VLDLNPVLFLEPRQLYRAGDPVADLPPLPMTSARIVRAGKDITCTAAGGMVIKALAAAERVAQQNISVEVVDLRCVMPLDEATIIKSVASTGRLLALDEAPRGGGLAAEVLALVAESQISRTNRAPLRRLTAAATPVGYAPDLATAALPNEAAIDSAMRDLARVVRP